ncbi:ATP-binding protein (plasmid) [Tistrella mobilis]|uniref:hybrid sensor histidine kinase/response regulator n=1 Tax=Tistrella mobilis TaxID=171437 RepID=UPI003557CFF0
MSRGQAGGGGPAGSGGGGGAAASGRRAGTAAPQRIVRVRRQYNQWVANQTLEDYALRFTAKSARRWSPWRVANTALGSISFLALEAIGGAITLAYGFDNAVAAILTVSVLIFLTGLPIAASAAKWGVDIDLLTRGAGFGYIGSTITSLIYASFTFIFFAIEAAILAMALKDLFGVPFWIGTIASSLAIIPIVTHGITLINRVQNLTQPVWIVLQLLPFIALALADPDIFSRWQGFGGAGAGTAGGGTAGGGVAGGGFDLMAFGAASGVLFALVGQIGEQVDFLRFLPRRRGRRDLRWWAAMTAAGPGWIIPGALKLLGGSLLAVLALEAGVPAAHADEPTRMYLVAFGQMVGTDQAALALGLTGVFVLLAQVKINVTNAYAGSIAWSNFFSRLTHSHPGRVVWLIFNVAIAVLLMSFGIYEGLEHILGLYSIVAIAWVGAITADLVINRPLGLAPERIEFRRAHLYDVNPVGLGAMGLAAAGAMLCHFGAFGAAIQPFAAFIALGVPMIAAPAIAAAGGHRFYLARQPAPVSDELGEEGAAPEPCVICEYSFEPEDMAHCPAYGGRICSLCCSLDARCHDVCKTDARLTDQFAQLLRRVMPAAARSRTLHPLGLYLTILTVSLGVIGAALALVGVQAHLDGGAPGPGAGATLWKAFAAMAIIAAVAAWLFVLARESRRVAQAESNRQTRLLLEEIEAHKATDAELQRAKEAAEAANLAKTRYVVGISHELRAPLNAIFGYAQILERDAGMPPARRDAVRVVRRSAEHLAGLIDGLLDISRIEAGHVTLARERIRLGDFLDQLVGMFSLAAAEKGIGFVYDAAPDIATVQASGAPVEVWTDEKRLRQILINLLSNAVKFTDRGQVTFRVRRRSQVAEFEVIDTGIGIAPADLAKIFEPFERGGSARARELPGTGLGLTIARLLTEILGGEISVTSTPGQGSRFRIRLFLSDAGVHDTGEPAAPPRPARDVTGYAGRRRMVLVVDDDPSHRSLIADVLAPLDFTLLFAADGETALALAERFRPDLVLLDISMPDMDGWTAAREMRRAGLDHTAIVMVSADAQIDRDLIDHAANGGPPPPHDAFVPKPVDLDRLVETVGRLLALRWLHADPGAEPEAAADTTPSLPRQGVGAVLAPLPAELVQDLRRLAAIGYVRGLIQRLESAAADMPEHAATAGRLVAMLQRFELAGFDAVLDGWDAETGRAESQRESGG